MKIGKKNKILCFAIGVLLYSANSFAQGIINSGASIIITTGANVYIDGDALGAYTNQTTAGLDGNIDLNGNLYVEGNWTNNATGNNVFINNTAAPWGTVYLNGAVASNLNGTRLTEFENLYIQNANRTLQITNSEVNNILTLDNATLILNQNKFIIDNGLPAGIASVGTGNVRSETLPPAPFSEIQWNIGSNTGGNYVVPFGTAAPVVIPLTFTPVTGTTGNLVLATYPTNAANIPYPPGVTHVNDVSGANNSGMTVDRFWEMIVPGALTSANVFFRCTPAEATGIPNPRAQRWLPGFFAWELPYQGAQSTAATGTNVVGMTAQTTWWTLADITSPLPVELLYFKAQCENKKVKILWSTASEEENKFFTVLKSRDGISFEKMTTLSGAGNSTTVHSYSVYDENPFQGINYYKLNQTDFNGQEHETTKVISFENCDVKFDFSVELINNPSTNPGLVVNTYENEKFLISVVDAAGRLVYSENRELNKGISVINLKTSQFAPGIYMASLQSNLRIVNKKFLIPANK